MHSVDSLLEANPGLRLSQGREVGTCWRHSPLPSHRVLDRSTGVNWFLADEVTAELSIVEALQKSSSYCSLGAFPFPSEPFHFLSFVRNEHSHQHGSAHPCRGAIMLLFFIPLLGGNATEDTSCPPQFTGSVVLGPQASLSDRPVWRSHSALHRPSLVPV